ncbi:MAG: GntR family transcriptional regulator [Defluviitaleaceae bacterium]|nr:GntR family transcriptional regulator [Defluviitaleaceae bacterium]
MIFVENLPIYVQIANDIKDQIVAGKLADGDKLLSLREYSLLYAVTALTMQRALGLLEAEAVIDTKKGVGSFVKAGAAAQLKVRSVDELVNDFIARAGKMGLNSAQIMHRVAQGVAKIGGEAK